MSIARKLFRLFKSFNEYVKVKGFLAGDLPAFDKWLSIATRVAFAFYWLFDNLSVLIKIKFFTSLDFKSMNRKACKFWLLGLVLGLWQAFYNLIQCAKEEARLRLLKARIGKEDGIDEAKYQEQVKKVKAKRTTNTLNVIKQLGDSITASQGLGYPTRFLGVNFNDGLVGVGGFTSAFITCYQTYPGK